ncbi:hypothetical protein PFICI_02564 [Pestalotiopsis fici W106-1]|uniref:Ubiquitin-like domain-containing protein n=1 Tax=Pestalotiopsis fici (strain W106-1 / CGMCC3.15140) TaxID=1229662 RepID=W3XEU8_PESFW|nr:uncharacterized protein PFICI_02564 [Pestalotiopsis fici W106-1]ETS84539.1 hypothetical protein PFICI_02564 [Pestalotiopsis fici W106-1]
MASFTFGSFGDIITLTQIAYKLYDAIDSNGSIAQHISVSKKDLQTFLGVCASIERAFRGGTAMSEDDVAAMRQVIDDCHECINSFQKYLDKFNDRRQRVRLVRRVQFSLFKKDKITQFETRMRHHGDMLGLMQAKYCSQDLKAHITNSLEPWDQKPMRFQDALGRRYPVPLEVCNTFDGFLSFLEFAFKSDSSIHLAVQQQRFWLITPKSWDSQSWYIVQEGDWKSIARPGAQLGMSIVTLKRLKADDRYRKLIMPDTTNKLPEIEVQDKDVKEPEETESEDFDSTTKDEEASDGEVTPPIQMDEVIASLKFDEPMPPWAPYDPNTNFQLLSPMEELPSYAFVDDDDELWLGC